MGTQRTRGAGRYFDRPRGSRRNWSIAVYVNGREVRQSVARLLGRPASSITEQDARKALDRRQQEISRGAWLGPQADMLTVGECLEQWVASLELKAKPFATQARRQSKRLSEAFGSVRACRLTTAAIEDWARRCLAAGLARGSVNVWLGCLRAALRLAYKREEIARVPHIPHLQVDNARRVFFDQGQAEALIAALPEPYADVVRFAYLTGWRRQEIVGLRWEQVDREARTATLYTSKNGDGRVLPLEGSLWPLIEGRWKRRRFGCPWVFHHLGGRRIVRFDAHWRRACVQAGLDPSRRLHDFRRTAVRDLVAAGVDPKTATEITGHRTMAVFQRYQIVDARWRSRALLQMQQYRKAGSQPS